MDKLPAFTFKKSATGKFDNSWDSDLYFMNLTGGNKSYKVSVVSDIPAKLFIRNNSALSTSENSITPGIISTIIIPVPGENARHHFDIRPTVTPDCGSSYTITIENYEENCVDNNEPNNTSATNLGTLGNVVGQSVKNSGLISPDTDVDYFSFKMNQKGYYDIILTSNDLDFDFTYYDNDGFQWKNHNKFGVGTEFLQIQNLSNDQATGIINVYTKQGISSCSAKYDLKVTFKEKFSNENCTPDEYENFTTPIFIGDTQTASKEISANIHKPWSLGDTDSDGYNIILKKKGTLKVSLSHLSTDDFGMFFCKKADGSSLCNSISEAKITSTSTEDILVYDKNDDQPFVCHLAISMFMNLKCANYKLKFEWTPQGGSPDCQDNTYEPNSSPSLASNVFGSCENLSKKIEIYPKIGSSGDYDYFKIKLDRNGYLNLNVFSDHYPVRIELSKDGYTFFKSKNSTGSNDPGNTHSDMIMDPGAEKYYMYGRTVPVMSLIVISHINLSLNGALTME
ncbi:MAG: hypothetical protein IPL55_07935 [Saprospiraceae bacterium]|nr:hypothetical protein [Saprospiraceae bacterium]